MVWSIAVILIVFIDVMSNKLVPATSSTTYSKFKEYDNNNEIFGLNTSELIRMRGYHATDYYITSEDGYILNLVRARNPLLTDGGSEKLENKVPLLLLHGTGTSANSFVVRSTGVEPKNFANIDASKLSLESLVEKFEEEPASKSLAFTALNFGHEVWLLNRRGTAQSLGHTNKRKKAFYDPLRELFENTGSIVSSLPFMNRRRKRATSEVFNPVVEETVLKFLRSSLVPNVDIRPIETSPNPRYWNYSLDEQALYDLPAAIDFVLEKTNRPKLAVLGHSAGSSMILMLLSEKPEYAEKVSRAILWAPAYDPRSVSSFLRGALTKPMSAKAEPAPTTLVNSIGRTMAFLVCQKKEVLHSICDGAGGLTFGPSGGQMELGAGFYGSVLETVSSHEVASLAQSALMGRLYHFDHGNKSRNMVAYGQPTPPPYDVKKITLRNMEVWAGGTDILTSIAGAKKLVKDLEYPIEEHYLDGKGLFFNHVAFIFHLNVSRLVTLPNLKSIETI